MNNEVKYEKLYSDPNIDKDINYASEKYNGDMEKILGVGLNMPFESANSAARKLMFSSQYKQKVCLVDPEYPLISTGYENLFGWHSSNFVKSDRCWNVVAKIEKFSSAPGHHYYLIIMDDNNNMDVIERKMYHHSTETYGFTYNNNYIDRLKIGDIVEEGAVIRKSSSFDDADNYCTGKNLLATYIADADTTEDAITVSESAAKALSRVEINKVTILINDNDIPLNLYGDQEVYKILPDIGENIKKGILCGTRIDNSAESFFTQSADRLMTPMINDTTFKVEGKVVDIDIFCNKDISTSPNIAYERQLEYYVNDNKRFCEEIVNTLRMYIDNTDYRKSYKLSKLYSDCEDILNGKQYMRDGKIFSNIIVEVTVYNEEPLSHGDKITSRYGGKGVISRVVPDDQMPRIHGTNKIVDVIWNQSTCVNRLNPGQLFELSLNYISSQLIEMFDSKSYHIEDYVQLIGHYYGMLSKEYEQEFYNYIEYNCDTDEDIARCIYGMISEDGKGIYITLKPISESMTLEKLMEIYAEYPWITPNFLDVPITDSRGRIRFVVSKNPSIAAMQYIYRMKQNAKEKHSATALSATNIVNENTKSKASKMYIRVHSSTPVRWGEMEGNILISAGSEIYVMMLMLYSTSPQGRRDVDQLLTGDPYVIDVQLSNDAKSRSVEKLNAIFKTLGIKIEFKKIPIIYENIFKTGDCELFYSYDPETDELFEQYDPEIDELFKQYHSNHDELFYQLDQHESDSLFKSCD